MTWNSAEPSDVSLHRSYHKLCLAGIIFRPAELCKLKCCLKASSFSVYTSLGEASWLLGKNNKILHLINIELGCCSLQLQKHQLQEHAVFFATSDENGALIGYLLAKTIKVAHLYNFNEKEGEFVDLNAPIPASLGISRIWTSPKWRRKGIATSLLNAALQEKGIGRESIAFSQPTSAGKQLFLSFLRNDRLLVFLDR
jgi:N-acetyltransferase